MRKLASIRRVAELKPIPGADRIEVALVDGWECVVKKGEFAVGEQVIYVEIDSIMPEKPEFEFLRDRKFRVRTIKLRKQISQGLVLPVSLLKGSFKDEDDVTEALGVTKYDPEAAEEAKVLAKSIKNKEEKSWIFRNIVKPLFRFSFFREWYLKKNNIKEKVKVWPSWITKTDEERVQNCVSMFNKERDAKTTFYVTEKLDGCSASYSWHEGEFTVCSRNVWLKTPDDSHYWEMANFYAIKDALADIAKKYGLHTVVLQGEILGEGIQKNKYRIQGHVFRAFNLEFNGKPMDYENMESMLKPYNIPCVPLLQKDMYLPETVQDMVKRSIGPSTLRNEQSKEGIVVRDIQRRISFKVINPEFLLKEEE